MGFLGRVFQKVKPKKKSKKPVTEVQSDGDENDDSILSVALEEQISQILEDQEDQEVEDRSSEDEDDEYTTPYWEKVLFIPNGTVSTIDGMELKSWNFSAIELGK